MRLRSFSAVTMCTKPIVAAEWTMRHCFFVIMGGFHLYDGSTPRYLFSETQIVELVKRGLHPPSEETIKDKSKGDGLSKALALIQTAWFITQCIARRAAHLPITELETVTLAYTAVNVVIYAFWWSKPLNADVPIAVDDPSVTEGTDDFQKKKRAGTVETYSYAL